MIRLQRVTFLALHDYLGLTTELTRPSDDIFPIQTTHRTQNHHRQRSQIHSNIISDLPATFTDTLNNPNDDLVDNENFPSSGSIATMPYPSLSPDQTQTTTTPEITDHKNEFENLVTPLISERTISIPTSAKKRTSSFAGQRSMSVVESRHLKPDFEEAAARARVKNSIDTTFFEKHKISYPNVSNNRLTNSAAARRRSSFSDVKLQAFFISCFNCIFIIS
jgi:hypothetical protein